MNILFENIILFSLDIRPCLKYKKEQVLFAKERGKPREKWERNGKEGLKTSYSIAHS